jgi:hypothetical protein
MRWSGSGSSEDSSRIRTPPALEREPCEGKKCVVAARVAAKAVVIRCPAIETGVGGILQAKFQIHPGCTERIGLAEGDPVSLDDKLIAIRLAIGAAGDRRGREKQGIRLAPGILSAECQSVCLLIIIGECQPKLL